MNCPKRGATMPPPEIVAEVYDKLHSTWVGVINIIKEAIVLLLRREKENC